MIEQATIKKLAEELDGAALSKDDSRGFELTSINAAYIQERITEIFGLCGDGWRYTILRMEERKEPKREFICETAFRYRISRNAEEVQWSEAVSGIGGNAVGVGPTPVSDAQKSALTNAIGNAAARLGVGLYVRKGLEGRGKKTKGVKPHSKSNGPDWRKDSQAFFDKVLKEIKGLDGKPYYNHQSHIVNTLRKIAGDKKLKIVESSGELARDADKMWSVLVKHAREDGDE